jgi:hypothetical protein
VAVVVGVYEVPAAHKPCYLIEMVIPSDADVGAITQRDPALPESDWQVPWDERVIEEREGDVRVAFFFHYLNPSEPLKTPWGDIELPQASPRPDRLAGVEYEPP